MAFPVQPRGLHCDSFFREVLGETTGANLDVVDGRALQMLRRAIELDPKQNTAYVKIGDILLTRNEIAAAKRSFTVAVRLSPTDRPPH